MEEADPKAAYPPLVKPPIETLTDEISQTRFKSPGRSFQLMDIRGSVDTHPQGCIIRFEVVPGSSRLAVPSGFNPWRKALEARLTEEPSRGKANRQLTAELAVVLGISGSLVQVLSGQRSARKLLLVQGMNAEDALSVLASRLK
jgi:uncharacterized protein (TIGR00251 family)